MKSILYVGATLMIGASIYGFVDYKKTSRNKEFTKMYDAKEVTEPVVTADKTKDMAVKKETPAVTKNQPAKAKDLAVIKPVAKEFITPVETITPETKMVNTSSLSESSTETKYKAAVRRKLSYKLFSRAPLEEKYINQELKTKEPGKAVRKDSFGEIKEQ